MTHYTHYTQRYKNDIKLPEIDCPTQLVGSTKQIAWAKQIRQKFFISIEVAANCQRINPDQFHEIRMLRNALYHETSASFLITHRFKNIHSLWEICQKAGKDTSMFWE